MKNRKTALVLSAGGMFGAYQAGAFKAIAQRLRPDIVIGASVGALNGWAIAGGCSPDELEASWLDPKTGDALRLYPASGWLARSLKGWFDPVPLRARTEWLYSQFSPLLPFGLVVVELRRLRPRLVTTPDVGPEHLHATCSIPFFLPAVKIDGCRCIDGGLFGKLPIWAALEMGGTDIIAVDSLPDLGNPWLTAGARVISLLHRSRPHSSPECAADITLTTISPSEPLGDVKDAVFWRRENVERWIELGERDAKRVVDNSRRESVPGLSLSAG